MNSHRNSSMAIDKYDLFRIAINIIYFVPFFILKINEWTTIKYRQSYYQGVDYLVYALINISERVDLLLLLLMFETVESENSFEHWAMSMRRRHINTVQLLENIYHLTEQQTDRFNEIFNCVLWIEYDVKSQLKWFWSYFLGDYLSPFKHEYLVVLKDTKLPLLISYKCL